ncbi:hypothetical protein PXK30_09745 [Phaeobacter gallaeciensis]|uniref:hypothetical protein n=1 Tax=Phaeobacter gallaeciensis TaxID=60890 RepID=UPI00237F9673|nr:hypothetical protein [Phaeobacter gallaeciensis]MDE4303594.1 hypothetical protein [Phaeobacter gallaeciensis]MDE4307924.1 hypothetical protein [Phaeobacter gallaeciensis]MDE4312382.1 hypothetical protein [Phaeobacter gallaeciensis]MDE4316853.1 hypothetical protein [Phaeobacter gallaeciensis]MDE4321316.1 hypothetical protein [Phaeobacter gallaeciensis]
MRILALDIATQTGIAVGDSGSQPRAWSISLGEAPDRGRLSKDAKAALDGRRFSNALKMTQGLIEHHSPDLIVVEAAIGGAKASHYLIGLVACVRGCAANRGVTCKPANLSTVRKHFLGRAISVNDFPYLKSKDAKKKAIKREVLKRCELLKWDVDGDDDAADACAIWDWACAEFARGYQAQPGGDLFRAHG